MNRWKVPVIVAAVVLVILGAGAASFTKVKTGTRVVCKYHHLVRQDITAIWVPRWRVHDYGIRTTTITCGKHLQLEALRRQALEALKKGDTKAAKQLFEQIKAADPAFLDVNTQLDRIAAGQTASPGSTNGSSNPPPAPKIDLAALLPAALTGFSAGAIEQGTGYAGRNYRPKTPDRMQSLLVTVHSSGSAAAAEQFVIRVDKAGFPKNGQDTTVNGYVAYFGTDGATYATLAWAKGTITYELQAHAVGGNPAGLEPDLTAIAASFK
jgi:hypothetical protein